MSRPRGFVLRMLLKGHLFAADCILTMRRHHVMYWPHVPGAERMESDASAASRESHLEWFVLECPQPRCVCTQNRYIYIFIYKGSKRTAWFEGRITVGMEETLTLKNIDSTVSHTHIHTHEKKKKNTRREAFSEYECSVWIFTMNLAATGEFC